MQVPARILTASSRCGQTVRRGRPARCGSGNCGPVNGEHRMPDVVMVDTEILVDVARGIDAAASFLDEMKSSYTPAVNSVGH